jgi:hypothetical protein
LHLQSKAETVFQWFLPEAYRDALSICALFSTRQVGDVVHVLLLVMLSLAKGPMQFS